MPAPGKRPDELRRRAIRLTPGRPGRPGPAWGCLRRVGEGAGGQPRDPARPGSARGFGSVAGDRPGTTTDEARRTGEPASGGPRAGGGGRDRAERVGLSWRRSVSARRADPPSASTSAREELRGPCRVCTVLTGSGCRIAPSTYYAARSRPPSKRSISDAAPGSRGDPRPGGGRAASTRAPGTSGKTWRLPGSRQEGPGVARCTAGAAHAGAGV